MKIEALADIHIGLGSEGSYKEQFRTVSERANVLIICGDLTQTGAVTEAEILREELSVLTVPCICVLGNNDYEQNQEGKIAQTLANSHVFVLQGTNKMI